MTLIDWSINVNFGIGVFSVLISLLLIIFYFRKSNIFEYKLIHISGYALVIIHSLAFILTLFIQIDYVTEQKKNFNFIFCQLQGAIHFISILSFLMFTLVNNMIFFLETIRQQKMINQNFGFILSVGCLLIPFLMVLLYWICTVHFEISDNKSCFILNFRGLIIFVSFCLFFYVCNVFLLIYFLLNIFARETLFKKTKICDIVLNFAVLLTMSLLVFDCMRSLFRKRGGDFWNFNGFVFSRDLCECLTGLALIASFQKKDDWKGIKWICCLTKKTVIDQRFGEIIEY